MTRRPRPPSRLDTMILLASLIAAALFAARADRDFVEEVPRPDPASYEHRTVDRPAWVWSLEWSTRRSQFVASSALAALTLGTAAMVVLAPRSSIRAALRRPGAAAVVVGSIVGVFGVLNVPAIRVVVTSVHATIMAYDTLRLFVPGAVLGAWAILLASGRWRPAAPDWRERLGRLIGWGWLSFLADPIVRLLVWG